MPTKSAILARLSRDELLGVLDANELAVPVRRVKDRFVEVLAASKQARLDDILLRDRSALIDSREETPRVG